MATFFFTTAGQPQDTLRYMLAGEHVFAFLEKGPLWLLCISRNGDTYPDMVRLLERVHMQILTILTGGIERTLISRPTYDMRGLLGGTENVVNNMIRWCTQDMFAQFEGFEPLPMAPAARSIAVEALKLARLPNVLFGFIMAGQRILAAVSNRQFKMNALDLGMVVNIIMSSASLRTGESWTPVCLTRFNDKGFAYAYISFIEGSDVGVVFLSTASDGEQFYAISQQATAVKKSIQQPACWEALGESQAFSPIDLQSSPATGASSPSSGKESAEASGTSANKASSRRALLAPPPSGVQFPLLEGIIHASYYVTSSQQYFSSAISQPYQTRRRCKMLFRNYGRCRLLLKHAKVPSQICMATDHECFYVCIAAEYQIYLAVPRGIHTGVIVQFLQWIKSQEAHLFLGQIPNW
eukprot:TRINITY_DN4073_c0_g2_i6.p1 TRINITY_DN4073_c0_g2~~TRINITY_DN4073_c0_g2_i6.p1  ORF type:complete len:410 (+),score=63.57 TRINITY_DN4073_c0_g2_i6:417-1646(+)